MKTIRCWICSALLYLLCVTHHVSADILLSQDFSSSTTVADYVSATPGIGQFSAISTSGTGTVLSIVNDDLRIARTGNAGSFTRLALDLVAVSAVKATISFDTVSSASQTTAGALYLGSGFTPANSAPANPGVHSRIGFNLQDGGFQLRDIGSSTNSSTFAGPQTLTWFVNNSGSSLDYIDPTFSTSSLNNDTASLWIGNTQVFSSVAATTATQSITDFKFVFTQGTGTFNFDSILVERITSVPEPSSIALLSLVGLGGVTVRRFRRGRAG